MARHRDPGRKIDKDEINVLLAIDRSDMSLLPEHYHPADLAWLSFYGYVELGATDAVGLGLGGQYWPEKARLTEKGKQAIK